MKKFIKKFLIILSILAFVGLPTIITTTPVNAAKLNHCDDRDTTKGICNKCSKGYVVNEDKTNCIQATSEQEKGCEWMSKKNICGKAKTGYELKDNGKTVVAVENSSEADSKSNSDETEESAPAPASVSIESNNDTSFFGLRPWNYGIGGEISSQEDLGSKIWIIASNIFIDITILASYLIVGFVIYGGYLYMFSGGEPGKVAAGKRTLTNAFIGLAITMLASIILSTIRIALIGNNSIGDCANGPCIETNSLITNLIGWVLGITGVVAVTFTIIGGVGYITSAGDPNKVQKSRKTLIYALIGLAIVGLSSVITAFVTNTIKDAGKTSSINETTIAKEVSNHEK